MFQIHYNNLAVGICGQLGHFDRNKEVYNRIFVTVIYAICCVCYAMLDLDSDRFKSEKI